MNTDTKVHLATLISFFTLMFFILTVSEETTVWLKVIFQLPFIGYLYWLHGKVIK